MLVDAPLNYGLVIGQDRVIPEADDARLSVPASILPAVLALQPTAINSDASTAQNGSVLCTASVIRPPSAAAIDSLFQTLAKGLWELECELTFQSDFAATPAAPKEVAIALGYQALTNIQFATLQLRVGDGTTYTRWRVLLKSNATLLLRAPATGVGQNLYLRANVNAIRIL